MSPDQGPGPASPAVSWAIKASFLAYVRRSSGTITVVAPARSGDNGFEFPLIRPATRGELVFSGGVAFTAHGGMLDVLVAEPVVAGDPGELALSVGDHRDPSNAALRRCIARLEVAAPHPTMAVVALRPRLTDEGSALFGGVYPAGSELDPLLLAPELAASLQA